MKLIIFRHLWGIEEPLDQALPRIKELGLYAGIESPLLDQAQRTTLKEQVEKHGFRLIPMIFTEGRTVQEHLDSFEKQVKEAKQYDPYLINCHSGRDAFSFEESKTFFAGALEIEKRFEVEVAHETHRGRILYNPWTTSRLLEQFEALKLCCDFSHWVCVCERLIDDQLAIIEQCAERAIHLHARVGYEEGPQVPDPAAPEYRPHLEAHERWWALIWQAQLQRGIEESSLTPEFGPPPYLQTLPHTKAPVANLWDLCNWQAERQKERFAAVTR